MTTRPKRTKPVRINFEIRDRDSNHVESLWATPEGDGRYRLLNSPFYAYGVSFDDVVFAKKIGRRLFFHGLSTASGRSTYRLLLETARNKLQPIKARLSRLNELGCTYEVGPVLALDVPPAADIHRVYRLLEEGEAKGLWEFEEGHCGHPAIGHRQRAPGSIRPIHTSANVSTSTDDIIKTAAPKTHRRTSGEKSILTPKPRGLQ